MRPLEWNSKAKDDYTAGHTGVHIPVSVGLVNIIVRESMYFEAEGNRFPALSSGLRIHRAVPDSG